MIELLQDPGKLEVHPNLKFVRLEILVTDENDQEPDVPKVRLKLK